MIRFPLFLNHLFYCNQSAFFEKDKPGCMPGTGGFGAVQSLDFSRQKDSSEMVDNNGRNLLFLSQAIENIVI
jgi:hypothetical protein